MRTTISCQYCIAFEVMLLVSSADSAALVKVCVCTLRVLLFEKKLPLEDMAKSVR